MKTKTATKFLVIGILMGILGIEARAMAIKDLMLRDSRIIVRLPSAVIPLPPGFTTYRFELVTRKEDRRHSRMVYNIYERVILRGVAEEIDLGAFRHKYTLPASSVAIRKQMLCDPDVKFEGLWTAMGSEFSADYNRCEIFYDENHWEVVTTPPDRPGVNNYLVTPVM